MAAFAAFDDGHVNQLGVWLLGDKAAAAVFAFPGVAQHQLSAVGTANVS